MGDFTPFPGSAYNISLADLLARNIFGADGVAGPSHTRIPFTFTSDLMMYNAGYNNSQSTNLGNIMSDTPGTIAGRARLVPDQSTNVRDSISTWNGPNNISSNRNVPAYTSADNAAMVSMAVNPQSMKWEQGKRFVKKDTQTGALFLFFSDQAGENNDILNLTISGTSGNIDFRALGDPNVVTNGYATQNRNKLLIWHKLYNLTRQPMFYTDTGGTGNAQPATIYQNNFYIIYKTLLMPFELRMVGFFSKVLEFTENASDPFKRDFTMQFTVTSTDPPLNQLVQYATSGRPTPPATNTPGDVTREPSFGQPNATPTPTGGPVGPYSVPGIA